MRPRSVRDGGGAKRARGGAHTVPGSRRAGIRRTPETKGHGKTLVEIAGAAGIHNNEALSNSLTALALSGIVSENPSWSLKTTSLQKRNVRYRVEDPYTRFYIKKMDLVTAQLEESGYAVIPDVEGLMRSVTLRDSSMTMAMTWPAHVVSLIVRGVESLRVDLPGIRG